MELEGLTKIAVVVGLAGATSVAFASTITGGLYYTFKFNQDYVKYVRQIHGK